VTATPVYDASGNMAYDGANQYLYDAGGTRVAKGTITSWSCDPTTNGFRFTENYVLGPCASPKLHPGAKGARLLNSAAVLE
jgi:hypothetical protein